MKARLLVADDNAMVRDVVHRVLVGAGYEVVLADDGPSAVAAAAGTPIDGAILDIDMPGCTGIEACQQIRDAAASSGSAPVIWLMTGLTRPEVESAAKVAGAAGVLAKPFSRTQLLACFVDVPAAQHAHV